MASICIPVAGGTPDAPGPPDWWLYGTGPEALDKLRAMRNDPRWRGAARVSLPGTGSGAGDIISLRALRDGTHLFLALHITPDAQLDAVNDRVWIGFHRPGGRGYRLQIATGAPPVSGVFEPQPVGAVQAWASPAPIAAPGPLSLTAATSVAPPPWIAETARAWIRVGEWAIHIRIPITAPGAGFNAGVEDGSRIGVLLQDWISNAAGGTINYGWPAGDHVSTADSSFWAEWKPPGDGACQGISLRPEDIGSNNIPASQINGGKPNVLFARPTNGTAGDIGANTLHADFRLANWGSTPLGAAAGPWATILAAVPNATPIPPTPAGTAPTVKMEGTWNAPTVPAGTSDHQCMLVELSGPYTFLNDSVYRNMDIVGASRFRRDAEISVEGLGGLPGQNRRNVYLYVDAQNLPERAGPRPRPEPEPGPAPGLVGVREAHGDGGDGGDGDGGFPPPDLPTIGDLAAGRPSYRVFVFHETGERWQFEGQDYPVLEPQAAFGYFVDHQGPLYGWAHRLGGSGLVQIAPNLYRLKIPNDGTHTVTTTIIAHETKPPWWRSCLLFLLAVLAAIVTLVRRLLGK